MSAKWRRNKTNSKFDILKVFNRSKNKDFAQKFRMKNSDAKQRVSHTAIKTRRISLTRKCREQRHLVDVLERADEIAVVADVAGFNRKDLRVHLRGGRLTVTAEASDRKYRKSLNLPKRVIPRTMRTTYKNGVLEIRLKKAEEKSVEKIVGQQNAS